MLVKFFKYILVVSSVLGSNYKKYDQLSKFFLLKSVYFHQFHFPQSGYKLKNKISSTSNFTVFFSPAILL